ncbi:hypothetical protein G7Y89_g3418 [Cudoniella acicularis]|uniref:Acyl-CoA dehydrogenase/oxidase C-terminal domain-containing protein n=1 Tax=Cudoniella acicularis TaxID=354080 RepID=A0A8H4W5L3_9HELO|nr:hypothetical protein G7Y89_g3418 [Cudoniella acicularis]
MKKGKRNSRKLATIYPLVVKLLRVFSAIHGMRDVPSSITKINTPPPAAHLEVFKRHAEGYLALSTGLRNLALPGGILFDEWDSWHTLIITDEQSRVGYTGVLWGLGGGNAIGVPPIVNFGTRARKDKFLPGVANGSIQFCLGITEPDVRIGGPGAGGISLLIIPLKVPGVLTRQMHNSGVGASGSTFIIFNDVIVLVSTLIHKGNRGFEVIMLNFNTERKAIATQSIRLSRVCVEDAWNYTCTRETFGKKLIENTIIRAKFIKMGRMIEPTQAFLEQLTWLIELSRKNGKNSPSVKIGGMTAMLKVISTRCLEKCVREAQQIMGGLGYARGGKGGRIEAISRDVRVMAVCGGSEEIMSELAIREEAKDLKTHASASSQL